jgi:hypothetical protein
MANAYKSKLVVVSTTGSNVIFFTADGNTIVRDVMIYAKGGAANVAIFYDDRTNDDAVAYKAMSADETWRPFATPLAMNDLHELKVNTSVSVNILITYVEFD